jgi:DNA-binding response OmpR family regulator
LVKKGRAAPAGGALLDWSGCIVRRKILVIEDESSIRNVICALLGTLKCDGDVAYSGQQALAMLSRQSFDAVLLDLRASDPPPNQIVQQICQLQPSLMGRILFITGEVSDRQTLELIEQNALTCIRRGSLMRELWDRLRVLLGPAPSAHSTR